MKSFDRELVSGNIVRSVWKLAWPVVGLSLVNGVHPIVDHALVAHYVPSENNAANAAIGASWQVFLVLVVFIASLFHGMNVMISRYAGKQDRERMSMVAYQAFLTSVYLLLFIVAPLGYFLAPHMLNFMHAQPDVQVYALPYLRILFVGGGPLFVLFLVVGAFQASGDAKSPLALGVGATVLHLLISGTLITGVGPFPKLGVFGAVAGTIVAPMVVVAIALSWVWRGKMLIQPPERFTLKPDFEVLKVMLRIGLPTGMQGVLLNIGGVLLFRFVGQLPDSEAAQAAYTICYSQLFSMVSWISYGLRSASSTLMGQNIGAGSPARGKHAVLVTTGFGIVWATFAGALFWFGQVPLLSIFNATHEPLFHYASSLLRYLSFSGIVLAAGLAITGGIQGAGETKIPMYIAFLTQIVILIGICAYYSNAGLLTGERIWMAILISHATRLVLTYAVFRTERWAHTVVELAH